MNRRHGPPAAAFLAVRVQGHHDGGRRAMRDGLLAVLAILGAGCSSTSGSPAAAASANDAADVSVDGAVATSSEDIDAGPADFDCLKNAEWTTVGLSRFKNVLGHGDETLAVARSLDGGTFPVGTIVQLVPTEASVKRGAGFNAASHDWEFFTLNATSTGTTITARGGGASVVNFTGSSCLNCHDKAAPQWDLLCGDQDGGNTHGCAPLPLTAAVLTSVQNSDPRCNDP
jgi:hypothetical protein